MATRRYGLSKGELANQVTEAAGAAIAADSVEVTVDLASYPKASDKEAVLKALYQLVNYIEASVWPPA